MTQPSTGPSSKAPAPSRLEGHAFARSVSGFTAATMVSRILGFSRDAAVAAAFGGGALTDSFYAAFRIANFFRRTLGEGALTSAFVPVLAREEQKGPREARRFLSSLWGAVFLTSGSLAVLGMVFSGPIVSILSRGFTRDPAEFRLTVELTRILFPYLLFVTLAAVAQGALNVKGRFFLPALAPVVFSISVLAYLGLLKAGALPLNTPQSQLHGLAAAAVLGGLGTLLVVGAAAAREGLGYRPGPVEHPELKTVGLLMLPAFIGMAADQLGAFADTVLASFLEPGSMTAIYNTSRLMQLPLGLFGVATAAVALPQLSHQAGRGEMHHYRGTLILALRLVAFLMWPSTVGLCVLSLPLVQLLFQHGKFTEAQSLMTSGALVYYSLGIAAYAMTKIFVTAHYALKDSRTPVEAGAFTVGLNIALCLLLMRPLRVAGLTLASSISAWAGCALLAWRLHRRTPFISVPELVRPVLKSLAASLAMGGLCLAALPLLPASSVVRVPAILALASAVYFGLAELLDIEERHLVWGLLKRKGPPEDPGVDPE